MDYKSQYLTIESLVDNNSFYWWAYNSVYTSITNIQFSTNGGTSWTTLASSKSKSGAFMATLNTGDKMLLKGNNTAYATNAYYYNKIKATGVYNVYGNILSIRYGDDFNTVTDVSLGIYFAPYFFADTYVVDASNLVLTDVVSNYCYGYMFRNCGSLVSAPALPAKTLAASCYTSMFSGCSSLTLAPKLPAKTLANSCYSNMFEHSKITSIILPATTLANRCYS